MTLLPVRTMPLTNRRKSAGRRIEQVNTLLRERVSEFLLKHLEMPGVLVTVTDVTTTKDLTQAEVLVSVLPESRCGKALERLSRLVAEVNRFLFHELTMRPVPRIRFRIDDREAEAARIEDLLDSLGEGSSDYGDIDANPDTNSTNPAPVDTRDK